MEEKTNKRSGLVFINIFLILVVAFIFTVASVSLNKEYTFVVGNMCGEGDEQWCYDSFSGSGFPLPYLFDNSIYQHLDKSFIFSNFILDFVFFIIIQVSLLLILKKFIK